MLFSLARNVHPEPVEGWGIVPFMFRQSQHERHVNSIKVRPSNSVLFLQKYMVFPLTIHTLPHLHQSYLMGAYVVVPSFLESGSHGKGPLCR